jgi:hypothetical protein
MREVGRVVHRDRDRAGLRLEGVLLELEVTARVRVVDELGRAARRGRPGLLGGRRRSGLLGRRAAAVFVVVVAARSERECQGRERNYEELARHVVPPWGSGSCAVHAT